jgi:hypothetical protein
MTTREEDTMQTITTGKPLRATGTCARCGAPIAWALTIPGHCKMPLDLPRYPDTDTTANALVSGDHLGSVYVRVETTLEPRRPNERRHMPHFATCRTRRTR